MPSVIEGLEARRLLAAVTPVPFQQVTIDPSPGAAPLEKALADIDGDGKLDAVIGHGQDGIGPGGIEWYQFPHSGNPADPWNKYTIAAPGTGSAYEDLKTYDLLGTGAPDVVASYGGQIVWFENPRNTGGDPTTGPWPMYVIGPGEGHEVLLADVDGDGKVDVITDQHVYFQDSPTHWTTLDSNDYGSATRSQVGVALFDSGSGLGAVDLVGAGPGPSRDIGWFENPRDHGGSARTDPWIFHRIGPNPSSAPDTGLAYASMDVNGDGRADVLTAQNERGTLSQPPPGGLIWWEAPADRASGTWVPHTIDASLQDVHRITLADINRDGRTDILFSEQEQSARRRVGIYYNIDGRGTKWQLQVLSTGSGHNQDVGDVTGDGDLDILDSPHGEFTGHAPIEVFLSQLAGVVVGGGVGAAPAGLVAQYEFEETSGRTAEDSSGSGNAARLVGSPALVAGRSGQALRLDGKRQFARANNRPGLDPTGSLTLSAWANADDWNANPTIIEKGPRTPGKGQYRLAAENGLLTFDLPGVGALTAALPSAAAWHLVTGTYDGSTVTLYVDGAAVASAAHEGKLRVTRGPLLIGTAAPGGGPTTSFRGLLDDVRVYARALSPAEVQALFAGNG